MCRRLPSNTTYNAVLYYSSFLPHSYSFFITSSMLFSLSISPFIHPSLPPSPQMEDTLWSSLNDSHVKMPMALTAEKLGAQYGITRDQCDMFALSSQTRWQNGKTILSEHTHAHTHTHTHTHTHKKPLAAYYRSRVPGQARAPVH